jgi:hypothetical protein
VQANVDILLAKASEIVALKKVTARAFRESDDYPALVVYSRAATDLEAQNTSHKSYIGPWAYGIQIYDSANNEENRETTYTDFSGLETLVNTFIGKILSEGNWELRSLEFFPAIIAGKQLVCADLEFINHTVVRYA